MTEIFMQGTRVALCRSEPGQQELPFLCEWTNAEVVTHYMYAGIIPATEEDVRPLHEWTCHQHVFACFETGDWPYLGTAGLYGIQPTHRTAEYRIFLGHRSYWGLGLGTEITRAVLRYGFERLNLHSVWLGVNAEHQAAMRVYEKSGFMGEGRLRERFYRNGRYYDILRMSILEHEYREASKKW